MEFNGSFIQGKKKSLGWTLGLLPETVDMIFLTAFSTSVPHPVIIPYFGRTGKQVERVFILS